MFIVYVAYVMAKRVPASPFGSRVDNKRVDGCTFLQDTKKSVICRLTTKLRELDTIALHVPMLLPRRNPPARLAVVPD